MHHDESHPTRVLAVTHWTLDPDAVVAAMSRRAELRPTIFGLLAPEIVLYTTARRAGNDTVLSSGDLPERCVDSRSHTDLKSPNRWS